MSKDREGVVEFFVPDETDLVLGEGAHLLTIPEEPPATIFIPSEDNVLVIRRGD